MKQLRLTHRQRQAVERRNQLIDTALDVFAEKGMESATVKDLAEAAGVAQGLIYHYFRSKEELLLAVVERHSFLPQMRQILAVPHHQPVAGVLVDIALSFRRLLDEKERLVRVFFREAQTNPQVAGHLASLIQEGVGMLARYLAARVAQGELRPHDTSVSARTLLYTVFMTHLTRTPAEPMLTELVCNLLDGIRARLN